MTDTNQPEQSTTPPDLAQNQTPVRAVPNAQFKAALLLILLGVLVFGSVLYLMYARGAFDSTQKLVLMADDSDGVTVGMDVTFSGFAIGRVRRIELSPEGKARIVVDVTQKDAHWLRSSSIFTLERGLVGGARLRAFTGIPSDPALEEGAMRTLLVGDASAEIPRVLAAAKELVQNLTALTASDAALEMTLRNMQAATGKLNGPSGALGMLVGDDKSARLLVERATTLLTNVDQMAVKADSLIGNADRRMFGQNGVMTDAQATIVQLNALLLEARGSLKKMDAVLIEAQAVGANARVATNDLGALRADVDINLRRIEQLVNEINRKWPFARDTEIKLP
jgi:phospholipid/cholesterol/gamma-HCH transport system substrate-binding protein